MSKTGGEALAAATALLKLSKVIQNRGATAADEYALVTAVPTSWRGWLVPEREVVGPHGERLFVNFLTDLREAITGVIGNALTDLDWRHQSELRYASLRGGPPTPSLSIDPAAEDDSLSLPDWARVLVEESFVWHAPAYGRPRVKVTDGSEGAVREAARRKLAVYLEAHKRESSKAAYVPHVLGIREIEAHLAGPSRRPDWDDRLGVPIREPSILFQLVLTAAIDRYDVEDVGANPVVHFLAQAIRKGEINRLCTSSQCDQHGLKSPNCRCWLSFCDSFGIDHRIGNSPREASKGEVAVQISAWQLTSGQVEPGPISLLPLRRQEQAKPRRATTDLEGIAEIGHLIRLQALRYQTGRLVEGDESTLFAAAAALDSIEDRGTLAVAATIASTVAASASLSWDDHRRVGGSGQLEHAVAYLSRSAAGAFRELRRPYRVMQTLTPLRYAFDDTRVDLKVIEARQDLQLGFQRQHQWRAAEAAFNSTLALLDYYFTSDPGGPIKRDEIALQKRREITEQLLLGRVGGLVQEAESMMQHGELVNAARLMQEADRKRTALELELQMLHDEREARHPDFGVRAYLRYGEQWQVMPALMKYRVAVARTLLEAADNQLRQHRAESRAAARVAHDEVERLQRVLQQRFLTRHRWELHRIRTVAALVDEDIDFTGELEAVMDAGGDDGIGDYVLPMLGWGQVTPAIRTRFGEDELSEAMRRLRMLPDLWVPRLPDFHALRSVS